MPVVNREDAWFGGVMYKRVIKVNSSGMFSCEIPGKAANELGISSTLSAKTRTELIDQFTKLNAKHKQLNTTTRKVIAYQFNAVATIVDSKERIIFAADDMSFAKGQALGLAVGVFDELTTKSVDGDSNVRMIRITSSIPEEFYPEDQSLRSGAEDMSVMEWTAEKEKFFLTVCNALHDLILKLNNLTHDPQRLEGFIRSGAWAKMLEGPRAKTKKE